MKENIVYYILLFNLRVLVLVGFRNEFECDFTIQLK